MRSRRWKRAAMRADATRYANAVPTGKRTYEWPGQPDFGTNLGKHGAVMHRFGPTGLVREPINGTG